MDYISRSQPEDNREDLQGQRRSQKDCGVATISTDREKIKELWSPIANTWFTEGADDPRITVIKVTPTDGYYWDTKHGLASL